MVVNPVTDQASTALSGCNRTTQRLKSIPWSVVARRVALTILFTTGKWQRLSIREDRCRTQAVFAYTQRPTITNCLN